MAIISPTLIQNPYWNIVLLALAWALTLSTSTLLTTVGPSSAKNIGASNSLAAFTIGIFLIGAAISSVPSGWIFRKFGRFWGFSIGCFFQVLGSLLGALSLVSNSLFVLFLGCLSIGLAQGLGQFYRFSAVEVTPANLKNQAVTYVLSGGIIAAFLGPTSASYSVHVVGEEYVGSYIMIAIFAFLNQIVLMLVNFPPPLSKQLLKQPDMHDVDSEPDTDNSHHHHEDDRIRPMSEIVSQDIFILSCTIATLAHTIMVMVMSNVSIDMQDNGFSFTASSLVMEFHFFAMFAPGFLSGKLIERYGTFMVALFGGLIFAGSSVVLAIDNQAYNFYLGMILVGIAWNFSFSAGTVMLTTCYKPREATEVQAINDFVLFSISGAGSIASGFIYQGFGWLILIFVVSVLMVIYLMLFTVALGKVHATKDKINEPLVSERPPSLGHPSETDLFIEKENESQSIKDAIMSVGRSISFSIKADMAQNNADEMTPLRSLSVA